MLDLRDHDDTIGTLTMDGGRVDSGLGQLTLNGALTATSTTNQVAVIDGALALGGVAPRTFTINNGPFSPDLRIDAALRGFAGIIKAGSGELTLNASNSFVGLMTVHAGALNVTDDHGLGSTANGVVVNSGASLGLFFGTHVGAEPLTLNGNGFIGIGALSSGFGSNSWGGPITLTSNTTIRVGTSASLDLTYILSGPGGLTKIGEGTLLFSGGASNTYSGETRVNEGTMHLRRFSFDRSIPGDLFIGDGAGGTASDVVRIEGSAQINNASAVTIAASGLFDQNTPSEVVGSLTGFGRIDLAGNQLIAGRNNASTSYGGQILGSGLFVKSGMGTMTLTGDNPFSGAVVANAGTLLVNGSQPRSRAVVNGGTLGGRGTVGDLTGDGNVAPGTSPGILSCSNLIFTANGDYFVEMNGPDPGVGYDQLNVRGTVDLNNARLHVSIGYPLSEFDSFNLILNDLADPISGTFAGLPHGSVFTADGTQFRILYGPLNRVTLLVTNQPLRTVSSAFSGGSGFFLDPNECTLVRFALTNVTGAPLTEVSATLVSRTPGISITQPFSAYPDFATDAVQTNETPFQVSVQPGFRCGTSAWFDLVLATPTRGTFRIQRGYLTGPDGGGIRFDNNTPAAIPDSGTVYSFIGVTGIDTPLRRVVVALHITHPVTEDLDISLVGPGGAIANLSSDNGGVGDNYGTGCELSQRTIFDANAAGATPTASASAPFVGYFSPEQSPSSVFFENIGPEVNGVWTLRVNDDNAGAVGTLECWSLILFPAVCADGGGACESCPERTVLGSISDRSLLQTGELTRNGNVSECATAKDCPGDADPLAKRRFDAYTFENGESNACITVTLGADCNLFSAAYTNSFNPSDICQNYFADLGKELGNTGATNSYSFEVTARARFVVVVSQVVSPALCDYRLDVTGGSCRPALRITPTGTNRLVLDWSTAAIGYQLERTNALSMPPNSQWLPLTTVPVTLNSRFYVTNSARDEPRFHRLRKP